MREVVLPLLVKLQADRSATTRRELAAACGMLLCGRARAYYSTYCGATSDGSSSITNGEYHVNIGKYWSPSGPELDVLATALVLDADENEDVRKECSQVKITCIV
jgi:hypothetical protein